MNNKVKNKLKQSWFFLTCFITMIIWGIFFLFNEPEFLMIWWAPTILVGINFKMWYDEMEG